MAIIYSYPRATNVESSDLLLICDSSSDNKATQTTTIAAAVQSALIQGIELPADDPENSVQFNLGGNLTGVEGFSFREDLPSEGNTLFLGGPISGLNKRGTINLYNQGAIGLWANTSGTRNQRVAITGPRGLVGDSPSSYQFALPGHDPILPYGSTPPNDPANENPPPSYTEPRVLVVEGAQYATQQHDSSWFKLTDLPGLGPAGASSQIQFNEGGVFAADPGLSIDINATRTRLDLGHRLNPTGRGEINIHSGERNTGQTQGGVLDLEYAYPTNQPAFNNTAAYAFVGLIGPEYDENIAFALQGYNIQLPVVTPADSTQTTYNDARLLVVNGTATGTDPVHQSKWITPDDLGVVPGGQTNNVQYKGSDGKFNGKSAFQYSDNNGGTGAPNSKPKAHEIILGAGGGGLPGMLTIFGDNDDVEAGGTDGILRFVSTTGIDYATISGPDIQTEITLSTGGSGYEAIDSSTTFDTTISSSPSGSNGNGLKVFAKIDAATGEIVAVSIANQGSGYALGDVLQIIDPQGQGQGATVTVIAIRDADNPDNEAQIYDIKLPKYTPFNDKIWFGKGTGKNGELTTNDYFKIKLVDFDPGQGHFPGGRLQLEIGSSNSSVQEPWGSILLNGGNNTNESGLLRLASVFNNRVGIMGPQAINPSSIPEGESYNYDFMLPSLPPRVTQREFINGVDTASINFAGTNLGNGNFPFISTTLVDAQGNAIPNAGQDCRVGITIANGIVTSVNIVDAGDGYAVGNILRIDSSDNPIEARATITVDTILGNEGKVLVVNKSASNTEAFPYETRWIDFPEGGGDVAIQDEGNEVASAASTINFTGAGITAEQDQSDPNKVNVTVPPRLNHGFSPYPIYQGNDAITVQAGSSLAIACNTICDVAAGQITVARIFGSLPQDCVINVAVYTGQLAEANTELVAFGVAETTTGLDGKIFRINLDDLEPEAAPLWSPQAGEPIVVVIEIDNSNSSDPASVLGTTEDSFPEVNIINTFADNLAFQISGNASVFVTQPGAIGQNNKYQDSITQLKDYNTKVATQKRVCHHFDPYAN